MKNLAKAIIEVMKAVKGVEKNLTVGAGNASYKGVADKEVKEAYNKAMTENGLCILPLEIDPIIHIERWEEKTNYGIKQKQSIFTEVKTKYLLLHESGDSREIAGYGQGVDSQDKGAGKATTYALKYALLYTFMTPTGKIDDADNHHSNSTQLPVITIEQAVGEMFLAACMDDLKKTWTKYSNFQTDKKFVAAKDKMKNELTPKTEE